MRERGPLVRIVGHGSSDNAATYGVYAFGVLAGRTALRDSIALTVYFDAGLRLDRLDRPRVVAVGADPGRRRVSGAGAASRRVHRRGHERSRFRARAGRRGRVPLAAGPELAVAATKTYLNQLAALALLAAHVGENGKRVADGVKSVSDQLEHALPALEAQAQALALPFAYVGRMFVIGRGPEFATARETALKLLETCRLAASPLTATDLVHGPVAVLDPLFPVWTIASRDQTLAAVQEASQHVREFGSTIVACGNAADAIEGADYRLPVPVPGRSAPLAAPLRRARPALRRRARPRQGIRP